VLQEFKAVGQSVSFSIDAPYNTLTGATGARLAVGIQGSTSADKLTLDYAGATYPLATGTYYQTIPLKTLPPSGTGIVKVTLSSGSGDHRVRVSTCALIIDGAAK
jgi:hypothetical protein